MTNLIRVAIVIVLLCIGAFAALPPGYEEELYCPVNTCLKRRYRPPGWSGPRTQFHECCDEEHGRTSTPRAWGNRVAVEVKTKLIDDGWHQEQCTQQSGMCSARTRGAWVRNLVKLLNRVDGVLTNGMRSFYL